MLRSLLVFLLLCLGTYSLLNGPFYGLLFYMWNAYFRPEEWLWYDTLRQIPLSFIIASYVLLAFLVTRNRFILNKKIFLISLFYIHSLTSTLYSPYIEYSWPYLVEFFKLLVICYMMFVLIDEFQKFRLLLLIIVLSLGLEAAKQGWYYLLTKPGWPNVNPIPFLGDNNGVALGLLMLVPTIAFLAQTTHRPWARPFYWLLLTGVLYRAVSTFSRGGFIACALMALLFWLHSSRRVRLLLIIVPLAAIISVSLPRSFWDRMRTITTFQEDADASALGRLHYWDVASLMARDNPALGVGLNAFIAAYDTYDFSDGKYGRNRSVHNSFFGILAELGYLGFALYSLILCLAFVSCQRVILISRAYQEFSHFMIAAKTFQISLTVFIIGGSFIAFQYFEMIWHYITLSFILEYLTILELKNIKSNHGREDSRYTSTVKTGAINLN
jgi:putative inorganic carbon (hco3(-)) transporter